MNWILILVLGCLITILLVALIILVYNKKVEREKSYEDIRKSYYNLSGKYDILTVQYKQLEDKQTDLKRENKYLKPKCSFYEREYIKGLKSSFELKKISYNKDEYVSDEFFKTIVNDLYTFCKKYNKHWVNMSKKDYETLTKLGVCRYSGEFKIWQGKISTPEHKEEIKYITICYDEDHEHDIEISANDNVPQGYVILRDRLFNEITDTPHYYIKGKIHIYLKSKNNIKGEGRKDEETKR